MLNNELKYFYERFLRAAGIPPHFLNIRNNKRRDKIKRIYDN
jgi:hypothetical protein